MEEINEILGKKEENKTDQKVDIQKLKSIIETAKADPKHRKDIPSMEELAIYIFDFDSKEQLEHYFQSETDEDGKRWWRKYKTALKASLYSDNKFKEEIVSGYNLNMDNTNLPNIVFHMEPSEKDNRLVDLIDLQTERRILELEREKHSSTVKKDEKLEKAILNKELNDILDDE